MPASLRNHLLNALPPATRERVEARGQGIDLAFKQLLVQMGEPIDAVYFPGVGVCSMVMPANQGGVEGGAVEVATVGREGFLGVPILLETDEATATVFCQIPGSALRLSTLDFRALLDDEAPFRRAMLRYVPALITQIAQNATCNRVHNIEQRAARWLLMTHDRVDGDEFPLTQEFLGQMLGVRRQAVNVAAGLLHQAGFITYSRGVVTILDRKGLEGTTCACYGLIRREFDRVVCG